MSLRLDRILMRVYCTVLGVLALVGALYLGAVIGVRRWPYEVERTLVFTPEAIPGRSLKMGRVIDYQDDCELYYDRRLQAVQPDAKGAIRRVVLPDVEFRSPPWELDRKLWEIDVPIPADFPCGPAVMIDSPAAACNWFQRLFWRLHREDAITRFNVACPTAG